MKRLFTITLLLTIIVAGQSVKKHRPHPAQVKNDGFMIAVVDGKNLSLNDETRYTAELKSMATDNFAFNSNAGSKLTRVAADIQFLGADMKDEDGNTFSESLDFQYTFNEGSLGNAGDGHISLNYNGEKFYSLVPDTKFNITKIEWSKDRRAFTLSADFDCKVRRWGMPTSSQPVMKLKGQMQDIAVTVPSWIVLKNPGQVAEK
ncbi:MAG TPA: hypothetical protein VG603_07870 [Chitinophagales bacterium]|nr:hypothetical protein [Chitinophagales bacterium]